MRPLPLAALVLLGLGGPLQSQQQPDGLQAVLANGYRFAYVESGAGRPVILVHGALGDYRSWEALRAVAPGTIHFIAYSRRYHAPNPWRPDDPPAGYETSASDLAALVRALRIDRPVVVGYSWGGGVALQTALRFPGLIGGLVLAEPIADSLIEDPAHRARVADQTRQMYAEALGRNPERQPDSAMRVLTDGWLGEGTWARLSLQARERLRDNAHSLQSSASPQPAIACDALAHLRVPVLLIGGEVSSPRFQATLDGLERCLPGARRETIPAAGHQFPATHARAFGDILARFLATLPD